MLAASDFSENMDFSFAPEQRTLRDGARLLGIRLAVSDGDVEDASIDAVIASERYWTWQERGSLWT